MPQHTISPTPSHQGLGITYSTLSPPPADGHSSTPPRLTGMGVGVRPSPTRPSPTRGGQPLFQPTFSLRPTHTRNPSVKGFTSFSAIPPSPAGHRSPSSLPAASASSSSSVSEHIPEPRPDQTPRTEDERRHPSRSGSIASNTTITSRGPKRSKSSELLRRFSKNDTMSGGRYIPLSGDEEPNIDANPASTSNAQDGPSRSRSTTISTSNVTPSQQSRPDSLGPTSSSDSHGFATGAFPMPPTHPPRTNTGQSDSSSQQSYLPQSALPPRGMSRSFSQPLHPQFLPEEDDRQNQRKSQRSSNRISDPATGIHSKNAVLLSAESGGMMLAFSPSGDGVWRQGQMIVGGGTGLIPTPPSNPVEQMSQAGYSQEELHARPWSTATTFQRPRPSSLGQRGRSLSEGATLARQGTLFHPASSNKRASAELGVMLGGQKFMRPAASKLLPPPELEGWEAAGGDSEKVRLEVSKKRKARVEVDVVLERECVVEGGEVKGRMEVRVTGGRRGEGLRVGGGKVRVLGFEELSPTSRHIFYHHPHPLPIFTNQSQPSGSYTSLFASDPDAEGYRLAAEGTHNVPFRLRLPVGGGAKGSYTSPGGKGPSVRYVVVGSIKIHVPSTGKRSIAHFYRSIVVLPYLNPTIVLAPSMEPVEAYVEKGLGWSIGGEKGRVEVKVALGRRMWVSGQRMWCEVGIRNDSTRKIKTLNLALLQTVQVFNPQPLLDTTDFRAQLLRNRTSLRSLKEDPGTPDADACQTSTQRRKVSEEYLEADFTEHGAGRVTGKGWWTGVEPGERGQWDMSLLIPPGMLSIRRTRLIEVSYILRVTVNSSIYVDLPVTLISFLSIDPPPMPGDSMRMMYPPVQQLVSDPETYSRPKATRMSTDESFITSGTPAKASSTTLHLDALLQAGRARAEAEGQAEEVRSGRRPLSMGSEYTIERPPRLAVQPQSGTGSKVVPTRPKGARMISYLSTQSQSEVSSMDGEEQDKALLAARYAQGRQRSLAAINRAMDRAAADDAEEVDHDLLSPNRDSVHGDYFPAGTPREESYQIMGDTPSMTAEAEQRSPAALSHRTEVDDEVREHDVREHEVIEEVPEEEEQEEEEHDQEEAPYPLEHEQREEDQQYDHVSGEEGGREEWSENERDEYSENGPEKLEEYERERAPVIQRGSSDEGENDVGNETILDDLVAQHAADGSSPESDGLIGEYGGYDYADEVEDGDEDDGTVTPKRISLPRHLPSLQIDPRLSLGGFGVDRPQHIAHTRPRNDSFATDAESEVGEVFEATKRNVSVRLPPMILPFDKPKENQPGLLVPQGGPRRSSHTPVPTQMGSLNGRGGGARRGSAPIIHPNGIGMRRESSNPPIPSPLRPVEETPQSRGTPKKPSFSFTSPVAPLRIRKASISPGNSQDVSPRREPAALSPTLSPLSSNPVTMLNLPSPSGGGGRTPRRPSDSSQLRNQITPLPSTGESDGEGESPGLAPSAASDSSDGQDAESTPIVTTPAAKRLPRALPRAPDLKAFTIQGQSPSSTWIPPDHLLRTSVNFVHTDARTYTQPEPVSPPESPNSEHSILPSVRSKIAQLESRDEALRKFSVSGAASTPPTHPLPTPPERPGNVKRRSYTTALAPRPVRSISDGDELGGTTFVGRRSYGDSTWEFGERPGVLRRHGSAASTSTSATALEAALMGWDRQGGSVRSRESEGAGSREGSTRSREGSGVQHPRVVRRSQSWLEDERYEREGGEEVWEDSRETLRPVSGLTEETDESEGLL